ncbi:hypothetical protein AYI68_g898 [Smittium mucronatum]|uniref:Uncharacterized protein n=1 Tax=Smittium mucronatum TaxID=133383 RepID=A0A1R0H764_9FUNG|nr:hypothetical protein AYI68_g898 [Smittium mucronatum]
MDVNYRRLVNHLNSGATMLCSWGFQIEIGRFQLKIKTRRGFPTIPNWDSLKFEIWFYDVRTSQRRAEMWNKLLFL